VPDLQARWDAAALALEPDILSLLVARAPLGHWTSDGVHPTPAGHAVIAERWRAAVGI